jgi:hypothetical protein
MNRDTVKKLLELGIFQAYSEGKTIQTLVYGKWEDIECPKFISFSDNYRIKPEPVYKPFDFESAVRAGMHNKTVRYNRIGKYVPYLRCEGFLINGSFYNWSRSLEFTFEDGTPCGVLAE